VTDHFSKARAAMRVGDLSQDGLEQYTTRRVVFVHPFTLGAATEVYAAGAYDVETKKQPVERGGHLALVRTSTTLIIRTPTGTCTREIRGSELDQALLHDAQLAGQSEPSENPDRGGAERDGCPRVGL